MWAVGIARIVPGATPAGREAVGGGGVRVARGVGWVAGKGDMQEARRIASKHNHCLGRIPERLRVTSDKATRIITEGF
jgi:hypothetical protein